MSKVIRTQDNQFNGTDYDVIYAETDGQSVMIEDKNKHYNSTEKNAENILDEIGNKIGILNTQLADNAVNLKRVFNAKGDTIFNAIMDVPTGTNDTQVIQDAINYCITNKKNLYIPDGEYMITNTIIVNGKVNIYCSPNAVIIANIMDKTKAAFKFSNNIRCSVKDLTIRGCGYIPKAGIEFIKPCCIESKFENLTIEGFRYGLYTEQNETLNRIVFDNCHIQCNCIAGVYFKSFTDGQQFGISAYVTFYNTTLESNGDIPGLDGVTYQGITILTGSDNVNGMQLYFKGFANFTWIGGQISNSLGAKNKCLVRLEQGYGLNMQGIDVEAFTNSVNSASTSTAIEIDNVGNIDITQLYCWKLNVNTLIELSNQCGDVNIGALYATDSTLINYIDVVGANTLLNSPQINLNYTGDYSMLSVKALLSLKNKKGLELLTHVSGGITPAIQANYLFDNHCGFQSYGSWYYYLPGAITEIGNNDFSKSCYIEKRVNSARTVFGIIESSTTTASNSLFFIAAYDNSGNFISKFTTNVVAYQMFGDVGYQWFKWILPSNTYKIIYGIYYNNVSGTSTRIGTTDAPLTGITLYAEHKNITMQDILIKNESDNKYILALNRKIKGYDTTSPTSGTYSVGDVVINSSPKEEGVTGSKYIIEKWTCVTGGSPGVWIQNRTLTGN